MMRSTLAFYSGHCFSRDMLAGMKCYQVCSGGNKYYHYCWFVKVFPHNKCVFDTRCKTTCRYAKRLTSGGNFFKCYNIIVIIRRKSTCSNRQATWKGNVFGSQNSPLYIVLCSLFKYIFLRGHFCMRVNGFSLHHKKSRRENTQSTLYFIQNTLNCDIFYLFTLHRNTPNHILFLVLA